MARDYANKFTGIMLIQFHFRYETRIDGEREHDRQNNIRKRRSQTLAASIYTQVGSFQILLQTNILIFHKQS